MSKALFLDRDGTLIRDKEYLADPAGVEILPGVPEALARARELGYRFFLFTNQSGIGRGRFTLADARRVNARMEELIGLPPPLFDDWCMPPEVPGDPSAYRKPSPRFIHEMIAAHRLDPTQCWMVGDRGSDIEAGGNAGVNVAAVCTGQFDEAAWRARADPRLRVCADFASFVATLA